MSNRQRAVFAAIAALIAGVAVIVLAGGSGDDEPETAATATPAASATPAATTGVEATETATAEPTEEPTPEATEIRYENGEVVGGVAEIEADKGDEVSLVVRSDTADEIHVHGYDVTKDVQAGGSARLSFTADIAGVFEIELEGAHVPIGSLKVSE